MSIPAQRFQFQDNQNIVPVQNFYSIDDAGVLNGAIAGVTATKQALSGSLFGLVNGNRPAAINGIISSALGLDNVNLATKLGVGGLLPGLNLPSFNLASALSGNGVNTDTMLNFAFGGNSTFKNIMKTFSAECLSGIFGNMKCPTNSGMFSLNGLNRFGNMGACNLSSFTNLLNAYTNGNMLPNYSNLCAQSSILRSVTGTAGNMGYPGFFSTLVANNTDLSPVSVVNSGSLAMGDSIFNNDPYTFMDISNAGTLSNSPLAGNVLYNMSPSVINNAASNLSTPTTLANTQTNGFFKSLTQSFTNLKNGWDTTLAGNPSLAVLAGNKVISSDNAGIQNFTTLAKGDLDRGNTASANDFVASAVDASGLSSSQTGTGFGFYNALSTPLTSSDFSMSMLTDIT